MICGIPCGGGALQVRRRCPHENAVIVLFNKPYGVLCQFTDDQGRPTLADYLPWPGIYAAGRLDQDSEGLLLLTDDGRLGHRLTDPRHKRAKTYVVQVEGQPDAAALRPLREGMVLRDGPTLPASVQALPAPPDWLWARDPPVRFRATIPTGWLQIRLSEGRNRQVRRMTAAVGLPTLRLIRTALADYTLDGLAPGEHRVIDAEPVSAPRPAAGRSSPTGRVVAGRRRP